jgi:hypothetical protein
VILSIRSTPRALTGRKERLAGTPIALAPKEPRQVHSQWPPSPEKFFITPALFPRRHLFGSR